VSEKRKCVIFCSYKGKWKEELEKRLQTSEKVTLVAIGRIIEYDGTSWTTIFDHAYWIYSLETYADKLYVGTANQIYMYNGTDWTISLNTTEGAYYAISLITYDGKIYAGMGNGYIFEDPSFGIMESETITVPEFPLFFAPPLFMIITLLVAIVYSKKTDKSQKLQQPHRD